ncbi:MAG: hypothetical protein MJZ05_05655 [Fibrobacter sp.]|nr:hypothetical protein [Fibrobacter sp.]
MKYFLGIILAFALILPSKSLAGDYPAYLPFPWGVAVGAGPQIYSMGADIFFKSFYAIYPREDFKLRDEGKHILLWTNRFRMIYEFENQQYGFLFQPNLRYLWNSHGYMNLFSVVLGPEIGWETKTGFEYGASIRLGGAPGLWAGNYEVGYLVNSKKLYFTFSLAISILPIAYIGDYRG